MKRIVDSSRARGALRGGVGGSGYEATDPDYAAKKLEQLKADYLSIHDEHWRRVFLRGLSAYEKRYVLGKIVPS